MTYPCGDEGCGYATDDLSDLTLHSVRVHGDQETKVDHPKNPEPKRRIIGGDKHSKRGKRT